MPVLICLREKLNEDLFYRGSSANLPRLHTCENKVSFWDFKEFAVTLINPDPTVLDALVTCDESWIYCYDTETKRQSSQWKHAGSPRPKKARQSQSSHKFLMIPFFVLV